MERVEEDAEDDELDAEVDDIIGAEDLRRPEPASLFETPVGKAAGEDRGLLGDRAARTTSPGFVEEPDGGPMMPPRDFDR